MDNIHERLFTAYAYLGATIGVQLDLLAKDTNPDVQWQRARLIRKLAQAVAILAHPAVVAEDQTWEHYPPVEVTE